MTTILKLDEKQLAKFRELRLWHWKRYLDAQDTAHFHMNLVEQSRNVFLARNHATAVAAQLSANNNLRFVQLLNDLFDIDDTAEKDANEWELKNEQTSNSQSNKPSVCCKIRF